MSRRTIAVLALVGALLGGCRAPGGNPAGTPTTGATPSPSSIDVPCRGELPRCSING